MNFVTWALKRRENGSTQKSEVETQYEEGRLAEETSAKMRKTRRALEFMGRRGGRKERGEQTTSSTEKRKAKY